VRTGALTVALLALAGCGERAAPGGERIAPDLTRPETSAVSAAVPVRVGEGGAAFQACQAAGTPRSADAALPVRTGPFDSAPAAGAIPAGAQFFVCSRSIDQRWMGIVFDPAGTLSAACGVSAPVPARADYAGPCRSGWVQSAGVRLVAD
jgi:hypothetical protein